MKAIIIGAGRGRRLEHLTEDVPKPLVHVVGRPMLESVLAALASGGLTRADTVFIRGYLGEVIAERYPDLTYVNNPEWESNNILLSLLHARPHMIDGFVSTYADIVYTDEAIQAVMASPHDITLVCDTDWRRRYVSRHNHPESDAEKLRAEGDRVVEVSRTIAPEQASGEFIGVMKATAIGASKLLDAFDAARAKHQNDDPYREGRTFAKAYLIDLLQEMVAAGEAIHCVTMHGGYMEIDTTEDAQLAPEWWAGR